MSPRKSRASSPLTRLLPGMPVKVTEDVTGREVQLVPDAFGQNDATRPIEGDLRAHRDIIKWLLCADPSTGG
jgi:hypothetical protein